MIDVKTIGDVNAVNSVVVVAMDDRGGVFTHAEWEIEFPGVVAVEGIANAIAHFGNQDITVVVKYMRA